MIVWPGHAHTHADATPTHARRLRSGTPLRRLEQAALPRRRRSTCPTRQLTLGTDHARGHGRSWLTDPTLVRSWRGSPSRRARLRGSAGATSSAQGPRCPACGHQIVLLLSAPPRMSRMRAITRSARSGKCALQPLLEQRVHLPRQADDDGETQRWAPASRAASRMRSSSGSLMNGITGDTLTPTGTPDFGQAADGLARRRSGAAARGSRMRASAGIERGDRDTYHRRHLLAPPCGAIRSRSRSTPDDLVMMAYGWPKVAAARLISRARVMSQAPLNGLVGIGDRCRC